MNYGVAKPHLSRRGHRWFARKVGVGCVTAATPRYAYLKLGALALERYEKRRGNPKVGV